MRVYTCDDRFDCMMTCIYDAWDAALKIGHDNIRLEREPIFQQSLFDEYVHVDYDEEKTIKVIRSIKKQISFQAYMYVYYASLSEEEDALQAIYNFLRVGFAIGEKVCSMYSNPHVMRMFEIKRKIGNESHFFKEFARFSSFKNSVYICHIEPKNNVSWIVGEHFADRMPSEHWMIIDDKRRTAVVHPKDSESYIRFLTDDEYDALCKTEEHEDEYSSMWKAFFNAISIKERESKVRQRNMFPIWMRKHALEFE